MLTIASADLPPEPASVSAARHVVSEVTGHLPRRARDAAELVTSELATNCVVHANTTFQIFAAADDNGVEVVVSDHTGWARNESPARGPGNGLLLVGLLSTDWSADLEGGGKRVWARLLVDDVPSY